NPLPPPPPNPTGNDTSSSIEVGPAIQITPDARGFRTPVPILIELIILLPPCGAVITPSGSPSPANAANPPINAICVVPGFNPISTVSDFNLSAPLTR